MRAAPAGLLRAQAIALPFTSKEAFDARLLTLSMPTPNVFHKDTEKLLRAVETQLRPIAGGQPLESLRRIAIRAWFSAEDDTQDVQSEVRVLQGLCELARRYLEPSGSKILVRGDGDFAERVGRFRWLSLALPADLLASACAAAYGIVPTTEHVSLGTPHLDRMLEGPVADTHLHVGAGVSFSLLWSATAAALRSKPPEKGFFREAPFGGGEKTLRMIYAAMTARLYLAAWLREGMAPLLDTEFGVQGRLRQRFDGGAWPFGQALLQREVVRALDLVLGLEEPSVKTPYLRRVHAVFAEATGKAADAVELLDPLARFYACAPGYSPELSFTTEAIKFALQSPKSKERDRFEVLFLQYVRVRCQLFRFLTQEPGVRGLDWFKRHFERLKPFKHTIELRDATRFALGHEGKDLNLASLEARTAPESSSFGVYTQVKSVATGALRFAEDRGRPSPEIGLVLHFIKDATPRGVPRIKDARNPKAKREPADPRDTGVRHGRWAKERYREARAIARMLEKHPESLYVFRGVDFANSELAQPLYPTLPILVRVREASRKAAAALARRDRRDDIPPLRVTYHAGEDFRRLVDGVRRLHELIEFGALQVGDRVGHGLALGIDATSFHADNEILIQPAEDRLDDLLWELDRYGVGDLKAEGDRYAVVQRQAEALKESIYGAELSLASLGEARRRRHQLTDHAMLRRYPNLVGPAMIGYQPTGIEKIVFDYLTSERVYDAGRRLLEVRSTPGETEFLARAQRWLRRSFAKHELTIETNPSSNLLIGATLDLQDHPIVRFFPIAESPSSQEDAPVLVSLNVDDPATFASRLADEYAYLYSALLGGGVASQTALDWLNRVRENGFKSRFTLPASRETAVLEQLSARRSRGAGRR